MRKVHLTRPLQALTLAIILLTCLPLQAGNVLFKDGKSSYSIVISTQALTSELTAARELQQYIKQISGAQLPITNNLDAPGHHIYVGFNQKVAQLTGETARPADYEGYTYRTIGKDILIYGGSNRGTMYGVFSFLEDQLGVRWLTPQCTKVPQLRQWNFKELNHSEEPAIRYRQTDYYLPNYSPEDSAHSKENMRSQPSQNQFGNIEGYWNAHTMGQLVPAKEFFDSHPEYFGLYKGERIPDGQLCLSNPEVLELCKKRLPEAMRKFPDYRIYSLSQNDNMWACQCQKCVDIENRYGGHSGLILWFVNQVADVVKDEFPDKYVGTFAYAYSRKPPVGIVPRENVVIRLCSIECCFAHPLTADCPENRSFMDDIRTWGAIAPHLFIWDYTVNYSQFVAPFPNFQVLGPNIETFRQYHAIGIYEESQYQSVGGEFGEMKAWVLKKLLWNPLQDVNALAKEFIGNYYGNVASLIWQYYQLCQALVKPDTHMDIYYEEEHEMYNDLFLRKAFDILNQAKRQAENEEIAQRVDYVYLQPLYIYCMRYKEQSINDGSFDELISTMRKYGIVTNEGGSIDKFVTRFLERNGGKKSSSHPERILDISNAIAPAAQQVKVNNESRYQYIGTSSSGLFKIRSKGGKYGYLNATGKEVIPCKYDWIDSFSEGMAAACLKGKWGYVTTSGKTAIAFAYEEADRFSDGRARIRQSGKWGYIDMKGKTIVPAIYGSAFSFSAGVARVKLNGKWGLIDLDGKALTPCKYDWFTCFYDGMSQVKANGKCGYVNMKGEEVVPPQYDKASFFYGGKADVKLDGKWSLINLKGEGIGTKK